MCDRCWAFFCHLKRALSALHVNVLDIWAGHSSLLPHPTQRMKKIGLSHLTGVCAVETCWALLSFLTMSCRIFLEDACQLCLDPDEATSAPIHTFLKNMFFNNSRIYKDLRRSELQSETADNLSDASLHLFQCSCVLHCCWRGYTWWLELVPSSLQ